MYNVCILVLSEPYQSGCNHGGGNNFCHADQQLWRLLAVIDKTMTVLFSRDINMWFQITLKNERLQQVKEFRYLKNLIINDNKAKKE